MQIQNASRYIFDKVLVRGCARILYFVVRKKSDFRSSLCVFCLLSFKDMCNKKIKRYKLEVLNTLFSTGKYNE